MASISGLTELLGVGCWAPTLGMTALVPAIRHEGTVPSSRRPTHLATESTSSSPDLGHIEDFRRCILLGVLYVQMACMQVI